MENEQKKIAAYIYDLEPAEGNAQQEIPLTLLVKRILETATYHAENWGVGYSTLIKENRACTGQTGNRDVFLSGYLR